MTEILHEHKNSKGDKTKASAEVREGDKSLPFTPLAVGNAGSSLKRKFSSLSPYKVSLFVGDLIAAFGGFVLGLWFFTRDVSFIEDPGTLISFCILSLASIAFFKPNNLYSYHFLFSRKIHLFNLGKSFCWSFLSLIIVLFLYNSTWLLEEHFFIFITSLLIGAVIFLFLSRVLSSHLLDFLLAIGMAFLIVGLTGLSSDKEIPAFMANGLVIGVCFFTAVILLIISRSFLYHIAFNKWLRRRFRRQVLIAGLEQEANQITGYIIDKNCCCAAAQIPACIRHDAG